MDITIDEILNKLNISQLKDLITLFGLEKPMAKSTKSDVINHIKSSGASLDPKMLINYFNLTIKSKREKVKNSDEPVSDLISETTLLSLSESKKRKKSPKKK